MKALKLTILLTFALISSGMSQEISNRVNEGFTLGNADLVTANCAEAVELNIPAATGTFSKDAGHKKLQAFFKEHPVKGFEIVHQGGSPASSVYQIGNLSTKQGIFRVYILYSSQEDQKVSEIRIEQDE